MQTKIQPTMRSFFIALLFLLIVSYWAHIFVTPELDANELVTVIVDNTHTDHGICECRCCVLSGSMCESNIRYSRSFNKDFSCNLCTNNYCIMNVNQTQQCQWMYNMRANCFRYEPHQPSSSSFIDLRPILQ